MSATDFAAHRRATLQQAAAQQLYPLWEAEVVESVAQVGELVRVRSLHSAGSEFDLGFARWSGRATLPQAGEICLVGLDVTHTPWVCVWVGEYLGVSPWAGLSLNAKIEIPSTGRVRTENGGNVGRLDGRLTVKAAQEVTEAETLMTVPMGYRPPERTSLPAIIEGTLRILVVESTGVTKITGANVKAGGNIELRGTPTYVIS